MCGEDGGCVIHPDEEAKVCRCAEGGNGPVTCDAETCSMVAQDCATPPCLPGEEVLATEALSMVSATCGSCGLGATLAVCNAACEFDGTTVCSGTEALCEPGEIIGMEIECEIDGEAGFAFASPTP